MKLLYCALSVKLGFFPKPSNHIKRVHCTAKLGVFAINYSKTECFYKKLQHSQQYHECDEFITCSLRQNWLKFDTCILSRTYAILVFCSKLPYFVLCCTAQKMEFSIKDFFSKSNQIWSHLLKKSLMENLIFCEALKFNDRGIVKRNM